MGLGGKVMSLQSSEKGDEIDRLRGSPGLALSLTSLAQADRNNILGVVEVVLKTPGVFEGRILHLTHCFL